MVEWVISVIDATGYLGVYFVMLIETVFPPIPSELVMPFAGFAAARGVLSLEGVIVFGTLGSLTGATILYLLARFISDERLTNWIVKHGHWLTVEKEELDNARRWFDRHNSSIVLFARLIPGVRSLISIPAGIVKMNAIKFLLFSGVGTAAWSTLLALAGFWLGSRYTDVHGYLEIVTRLLVALVVTVYIYRLSRYHYRRYRSS